MNYRFLAQNCFKISQRTIRFNSQRSDIYSRFPPTTPTTTPPAQLTAKTRRWAIKQYVLLFGLPITTYIVYRLSTSADTRRKHRIVLGSIGRAFR